jgi:hypothetical protein
MLCELVLLLPSVQGKTCPALFYAGIAFLVLSLQCIMGGFIAELAMRNYYAVRGAKPYAINESASYIADV